MQEIAHSEGKREKKRNDSKARRLALHAPCEGVIPIHTQSLQVSLFLSLALSLSHAQTCSHSQTEDPGRGWAEYSAQRPPLANLERYRGAKIGAPSHDIDKDLLYVCTLSLTRPRPLVLHPTLFAKNEKAFLDGSQVLKPPMPIPTESWLPVLFHAALRPGMRSQAYIQYATQ